MYREVDTENAERGAALLDRHWAGWEDGIELGALNMHSSDRCVLGQLYGTYGGGLQAVFGEERERVERKIDYGFTLGGGGDYASLTAAWRRVIEARRAEA